MTKIKPCARCPALPVVKLNQWNEKTWWSIVECERGHIACHAFEATEAEAINKAIENWNERQEKLTDER